MTKPQGKDFLVYLFCFIIALMLILYGAFVGILSLDKYLRYNNYVLCNINDLKMSNDILNGGSPLKYLANMTKYSESGLLNKTVPVVVTWER